MSGFILTDLYIMRKRLMMNFGFCLVMMVLMEIGALLVKNNLPEEEWPVIAMTAAIMVAMCFFMIVYTIDCEILFADERRKWNAYSAASEAGVKAVVGAKYTLCFIISFSVYLLCGLNDIILSLIFDRTVQLSVLYLGLVFAVSAIMAFQLFFGIRFGARYGTNVRIALFVALFVLGSMYALFGNLDWLMAEGGVKDKMRYILEHMDDAGMQEYLAKLSGGAMALLCLIPHAIVGIYWGSYRFSCKVYTKGAENYEK